MKVRAKVRFPYGFEYRQPGDEFDVDDRQAALLMRLGHIETVESARPNERSTERQIAQRTKTRNAAMKAETDVLPAASDNTYMTRDLKANG